jgi:hypothetical protein
MLPACLPACSGWVHTYTLYWYMRPFGASVLLASVDDDGPQLHMIEPSGVTYVCLPLPYAFACAMPVPLCIAEEGKGGKAEQMEVGGAAVMECDELS